MRKKLLFLAGVFIMLPLCACSVRESNGSDSASSDDITQVADPIEWERDCFLDEVGKQGNKPYERAMLHGAFSNSATTGSDLTVYIIVEKDSTIRLKLAEYEISLVKDVKAVGKMRNTDGNIEEFYIYFDTDGSAKMRMMSYDKTIKFMLSEGEKDVILTERNEYASVPSTYVFSIPDGASIANAIKRLQD